jgi:D-amino peptidase
VPGVRRVGERSVEYAATSAYEMIRCFKVVCTMISAALEAHYG